MKRSGHKDSSKYITICKEDGFSLVELMVALALTGIVMAAAYTSFTAQVKTYDNQTRVAEMQQELRAAIDIMVRDIQMAGYDPLKTAATTIETASSSSIQFTVDVNADGNFACNADDRIQYALDNDADNDGIADAFPCNLGRQICGGGLQDVAENIQAIGFAYAYDDDADGILDATAGGIIWAIDSDGDDNLDTNLDTNNDGEVDANDFGASATVNTGTVINPAVPINAIRAVKIWILARSGSPDNKFTDTKTYVVGNNRITPNDNYRHRLLTTTVKCRNMGLQ